MNRRTVIRIRNNFVWPVLALFEAFLAIVQQPFNPPSNELLNERKRLFCKLRKEIR